MSIDAKAQNTAASEMFNRREASVLAGVSLRSVDKAIEERVVRARRPKTGTFLDGEDVITIAIVSRAGLPLQLGTKHRIRKWLRDTRPYETDAPGEFHLSDVMVVRLDSSIRSIADQLNRYREDRARFVESNPRIRSGEPVIAGTRMPVRAVAERIENGDSIGELTDEYGEIPREAFEAALIYAQSHPRRGRPARPWRDD